MGEQKEVEGDGDGERGALVAFLLRVVGGPAEQLSGIAEDWLRYYRVRNLISLKGRVETIYSTRSAQGQKIKIPPKIALPLLDAASLEEEPEIQAIWARMLVNATDPDYQENIHPAFVQLIKQLSVDEAVILDALSKIRSFPRLFSDYGERDLSRQGTSRTLEAAIRFCGRLVLRNGSLVPAYLENLQRLGLVENVGDLRQELIDRRGAPLRAPGLLGAPLDKPLLRQDVALSAHVREEFRFTKFGANFALVCLGKEQSPE